MSKELVSDELWKAIKPLLPEWPDKPKGGRPRVPDRAALTSIVFVLKSGIPWKMLPKEMGFVALVLDLLAALEEVVPRGRGVARPAAGVTGPARRS
jgi:transposase